MIKKMRKLTALALSLSLLLLCLIPAYANGDNEATELQFNENGEFKIIQFADLQDDCLPASAMIKLIEKACAELKPDLVVLSGDNVSEANKVFKRAGIHQILAPIAKLGIPYAFTFGNHDAEYGVSKEQQHKFYMENGNCLTYNADDSIHGYGNCNLPILSNDGTDIAFNLWIIDSNMYHEDGGYDIVYPDQVEWYKNTSIALEQEVGHKVPSLVFQHIVPPEIFDYLEPAPRNENGEITTSEPTKGHIGRDDSFLMKFKADAVLNEGYFLQEFPCPPSFNTNEVEVMAQRGDVLGIAYGHDHTNNYVLSMDNGIDLIQTPGMSFQSYGKDNVRGFRLFTLDEENPWSYETETFTYYDFMSQSEIDSVPAKISQFFSSLKIIFEMLFKTGFEFVGGKN